MTPETVSEAFIKWMEDNGYGTYNTDIFLNQIDDDAPDNAWRLTTGGGDVTARLVTAQNRKQYITQVFYRNTSGKAVERRLFELETQLNTPECFTVDGFEVYSIESTMTEDADKDVENRRQGLLTVTIEIYKTYVS